MTRRTPARLLAPLALVVVAAALVFVVSGGPSRWSPGAGAPATAGQPTPTATPQAERRSPAGTKRTYTVRPGDTPSGIAEKTGISVERLLELNPDVDAQSLQTGARLKLR